MKVLLFANDGCGSCVKWRPTFIKLMNKYHLEFDVINQYDPKNSEIVKKYDVHGIPLTLFIGDNGSVLGDILGNMLEEFADRDIKYYIEKNDRLRKA